MKLSTLVALAGCSFAFVTGCGLQQGETSDEPQLAVSHAALDDNGGYTTGSVCTACGCTRTDVACNCGMPPSKKKVACIENGGPVVVAPPRAFSNATNVVNSPVGSPCEGVVSP